ncbi:hypothetical protein HPB52_015400 [Rhipicephalus sanguineus]|uniref:Uncharacterized protein n=1 Tax=Rhipicephalus sanguineus TaxID=34632 RepID=A0A9D4PFT5_RHISA|nr:hypothetical protein HPB52_015400 [Rhipicephalus sanguineus]
MFHSASDGHKLNPDLITKSWDPFPVMGFFVEFCQSDLNRTGRCMSLPDCRFSRGTREGDCADGFGVCCIYEARNNVGTTLSNNSYFVQPGFPKPFAGGENVSLTVLLPSSTCQLRLELEEFHLLPPVAGRCLNDSLRVFVNGSDSYVPELCGHNAGQHGIQIIPIYCHKAVSQTFSGTDKDKVDVEDWVEMYERVRE